MHTLNMDAHTHLCPSDLPLSTTDVVAFRSDAVALARLVGASQLVYRRKYAC